MFLYYDDLLKYLRKKVNIKGGYYKYGEGYIDCYNDTIKYLDYTLGDLFDFSKYYISDSNKEVITNEFIR